MTGPFISWKCFTSRPFVFSKCGPWTSSISFSRELGRNAESQASLQTSWIRTFILTSLCLRRLVCPRKFEKPIYSQQSHFPSLRSGVLSTFEVTVLCSTMFGVFPLRGGPLNLARTLANQTTSSKGFNEENKMFQVVQLSWKECN